MTLALRTLATVAVLASVTTPAMAQVDVRVKVDTTAIKDAAQEIRAAVHSTLGPEFRLELQEAARDISRALEGLGDFAFDAGGRMQSQRFRATQTDRETRTFNVGANGQLDLETLSGDITVRRTSGRDLQVEVIREARGATDAAVKTGLAEVKAVSEERGGRVTIKAVYPSGRRNPDYSVNVSYIVSAPAGTRISAQSLSGNVSVSGIDGELSVNTMSGSVTVTDATRLTNAKTLSGNLTLTNVQAEGLLQGSTMSGDITATGVKARRVNLSTVSGGVSGKNIEADDVKLQSMSDDVVFDGRLSARGRYEFSSHSGDVRLTFMGDTGFSLEASTFSGSVRSDLPLQNSSTGDRGIGARRTTTRSLKGTFGDGSAVVSATTFSGSVTVAKR